MLLKLKIFMLLAVFINITHCFPSDKSNVSEDDESRIVGGKAAAGHQFPFIVSIQIQTPDFQWFPICVGSIISPATILTAAHCFEAESVFRFRVVAGSIDAINVNLTGQIRTVVNIKKHPEFYRDEYWRAHNDVALLTLDAPFTMNAYVQQIALPNESPRIGNKGQTAGWGDIVPQIPGTPANTLMYAEAQIYDKSECEQDDSLFGKLKDDEICVGAPKSSPNQSVCRGDSGGPFVIDHRVAAVVSMGSLICGMSNAVFFDVYHYKDWIKSNMT